MKSGAMNAQGLTVKQELFAQLLARGKNSVMPIGRAIALLAMQRPSTVRPPDCGGDPKFEPGWKNFASNRVL